MSQRVVRPSAVEVQVGLVLLHAQRVVFLHVLVVDGRIVGQVLQVRLAQRLNVALHVRLQLLVLLILGKGRVGDLRAVLRMGNVPNGQRVAHHGSGQPERVVNGRGALGHAACQHPQVVQLLVLALQLVHVLQDGQQLLLGLQHVGSHARVVLLRHVLQKLVEVLGVGLGNLQGVQHAHRLLNVVVLVARQVCAVGQRLVGRNKLLHRLIMFQVDCRCLRQVGTCNREQ